MEVLIALDRVILSLYQRVADRFELWTGHTCFNAARLSAILYFGCGLFEAFELAQRHPTQTLGNILNPVLILGVYFILSSSISRTEQICRPGTRNYREMHWLARISLLLVIVLVVSTARKYDLFDMMSMGAFFSSMYFESCTPLPPGTRKTKKVKSLKLEFNK